MQREYMYELLAKMKEGNRQAFHAFYDATYQDVYRFHDYTLEEIAVLPPGTVKSRYHAGLEALRKYVRNLPPGKDGTAQCLWNAKFVNISSKKQKRWSARRPFPDESNNPILTICNKKGAE